jgi:hypothetical protein
MVMPNRMWKWHQRRLEWKREVREDERHNTVASLAIPYPAEDSAGEFFLECPSYAEVSPAITG